MSKKIIKKSKPKKTKKRKSVLFIEKKQPGWIERALKVMKDKKITQAKLARALGKSRPTISNYFAGNRLEEINTVQSFKTLQSIANVLQIDIDYLLYGENNSKKPHDRIEPGTQSDIMLIRALTPNLSPVLYWHENWRDIMSNLNREKGKREFYPSTNQLSRNGHFYYVRNDVMEPAFVKGDKIFVDPDITPEENDFIVVRHTEKEANEFYQLISIGGEDYLTPLNPRYPRIKKTDEWEVIGVVTEVVKHFKKREYS
jgi:transcriptional regulator with XRE-family HTH domain